MSSEATAPLVLLVDDDRMVRLLARQALEHAGFRVQEAADGIAAVEQFDAHQPDLVLLDVVMPRQDGYETCAIIRGRASGVRIPILMMTASDDVESIHRAFEIGATDFVNKPLPWTLLGYRVRYMLRSAAVLRELAQSEERLSAAQRVAKLGYWEWNIGSDAVSLSEMSQRMLGDAARKVSCVQDVVDGVHPEDRERVRIALRETAATERPLALEFRTARIGESEPMWMHAQGRIIGNVTSEHRVFNGTLQDISDIKRSEAQTRYLAYFDTLTGLPNRVSLGEHLQQSLSSARRHGRTLAMLLLDLDNFKQINETLGHEAGDRLLSVIATRLRNSVRLEDGIAKYAASTGDASLARMGGDEFSLLISELATIDDADRIAQRVLQAVSEPIVLDGHEIVVSASVGISVFPLDGNDANTLMANADAAMYHAKDAGGNRACFYNKPMRSAAANRFSLEMALRRALERDQFMLHFQPKLDLTTGRITSVEALLRWNHPELGLVSPLEFIPVAEETGLILNISDWVLHTACTEAKRWREKYDPELSVAVNLSARHFRQPDLANQIAKVLRACNLEASGLVIEITESAIMGDPDLAQTITRGIMELGCDVAIDDFGTGYSSLAYLKQFAISHLKIDRSFISGLTRDANDVAIVNAVIAMANILGMRVVAEGVETEEQLSDLMKLGCHEAQGYLISRPINADGIDRLLEASAESALALSHFFPQPLR